MSCEPPQATPQFKVQGVHMRSFKGAREYRIRAGRGREYGFHMARANTPSTWVLIIVSQRRVK